MVTSCVLRILSFLLDDGFVVRDDSTASVWFFVNSSCRSICVYFTREHASSFLGRSCFRSRSRGRSRRLVLWIRRSDSWPQRALRRTLPCDAGPKRSPATAVQSNECSKNSAQDKVKGVKAFTAGFGARCFLDIRFAIRLRPPLHARSELAGWLAGWLEDKCYSTASLCRGIYCRSQQH